MAEHDKPLSALVAQGWEVVSFASGTDPTMGTGYQVLLRRQKQHKILLLRKAWVGNGLVAKEIDV